MSEVDRTDSGEIGRPTASSVDRYAELIGWYSPEIAVSMGGIGAGVLLHPAITAATASVMAIRLAVGGARARRDRRRSDVELAELSARRAESVEDSESTEDGEEGSDEQVI